MRFREVFRIQMWRPELNPQDREKKSSMPMHTCNPSAERDSQDILPAALPT